MAVALLGASLLIALAGWLTRPKALRDDFEPLTLPGDPTAYLGAAEERERRRFGIIEGAQKRIVWADGASVKSDYVVIYLHGFSATRQEIAPIPQRVAKTLGANLFEARLAGHGRERSPLCDVSAEDWLHDGVEALAIGKALGHKLIVIGISTGATLALAMARHPDFRAVDSLVLVSPNFGPAAAGADLAIGPFGPQLTRLVVGSDVQWEPVIAAQGRYWSTRYPSRAIVEMMRLVKLAVKLTPEIVVPRALLIYSPQDDVVSVRKLVAGFAKLQAARKKTHRIDQPNSLSTHVIAGDILAPGASAQTTALIVDFLQGAV